MSVVEPSLENPSACASCLRRAWLLSALSTSLDYQCRDRARLFDLLELGDEQLVQAIGGRRRRELRAACRRFDANGVRLPSGVQRICRHDSSFPAALRDPGGPWMLNVTGGLERLRAFTSIPTVAIIGSTRATDYGMETAKDLARGLAASGVTVTSGLSDGIAVGALAGALEVKGRTVTVVAGGLDVASPARRRSLYERATRAGCGVAELPSGCEPRRWTQAAAARILARLANLTVVVEAEDSTRELVGARIAQALGRTVAAVPGRVTSRTSSGAHALLMGGAHLVRGPADALGLLCGVGAMTAAASADTPPVLEPSLKHVLDRVGAGSDTPNKLASEDKSVGDTLLALSELELMGLLARGDGGRYVPRRPAGRATVGRDCG